MRPFPKVAITGWQTNGIDLNGLNDADKKRISQVGFLNWLDEVSNVKTQPKKAIPVVSVAAAQQGPKKLIATTTVATPQQSQNKVKPNSVGYPLAMEFIRLAKENKDIVTYEQCEKMCPAYPTDPASWARAMGLQVQTEKKFRRYKVLKYV